LLMNHASDWNEALGFGQPLSPLSVWEN